MSVQKGWRSCDKCSGLFYAPVGNTCPRGGAHDASESTGLLPFVAAQSDSQDKWRWCKRCGAMFYSGLGNGVCPAGGGHDASGSGQYWIQTHRPAGLAQAGWRWCKNCQVLHRPWPRTTSTCPAANGGPHSVEGSGEYGLRVQLVGQGIAVAYQGRGNDGTIWLSLRHDYEWLGHLRVPGGCSVTPSPVMFGNKLYIFYQGMGDCRELWFTTFDGLEFSASKQVPNIRLKGAPSAFVCDGRLEVWVQGTSRDCHLWRNRATDIDNNQWQSELVTPNTSIWNDPGALPMPANGGGALVFYEQAMDTTGGKGSTGYLYFVNTRSGVHEKVTWKPARGTPAPVIFQGRVYVFRESSEGDGAPIYWSFLPGDNWKSTLAEHTPYFRISGVVAPVIDTHGLWVFFEGAGNSGELYCVETTNGTNWNAPIKLEGIGVSTGCGGTRYNFSG